MDEDPDFCPETLTGKHAWYQTTMSEFLRDWGPDKRLEQEEEAIKNGHWSASHACKCGRWEVMSYSLPDRLS